MGSNPDTTPKGRRPVSWKPQPSRARPGAAPSIQVHPRVRSVQAAPGHARFGASEPIIDKLGPDLSYRCQILSIRVGFDLRRSRRNVGPIDGCGDAMTTWNRPIPEVFLGLNNSDTQRADMCQFHGNKSTLSVL